MFSMQSSRRYCVPRSRSSAVTPFVRASAAAAEMPCRLTVYLQDGRILVKEKADYEGFKSRPMDWSVVVLKFERLAQAYAGGSFSLMPRQRVKELNDLAHQYDVLVSTRMLALGHLGHEKPVGTRAHVQRRSRARRGPHMTSLPLAIKAAAPAMRIQEGHA